MADSTHDQRPAAPPERSDSVVLTMSDLIKILRKHWISLVVTFAVVMGAACAWTMTRPVAYSSTTQLYATYNYASGGMSNSSEQNSGSSYIMSQIKSYPTLTTTHAVLQPVIDGLGLRETVPELASRIAVSNPANTAFVNIAVTGPTPQEAAEVADAVADSLSRVVERSLYAGEGESPVKLTVVQPASPPVAPSSPKVKQNLALGAVLGLVLGLGVAVLRDVLSRRIQYDDEIGEYVDAPTIGKIPESPLLAGTSPAVVGEPGGPIAEAFRRIRTNLSYIAPVDGTNCRLIVVTSAGPSEGKTTICANIAAALAENGARTLLIDADLRHPSVAARIGVEGSAGLTHVLSGQATVRDVVQRFWKPNLHVMPAGPKPPNASTLLNSPIMAEMVTNALERYDYVIIDTAPMAVANDAVVFVRRGGSLVMVCRRDRTRKHDLRDVGQELATLDMSAAGIVFNCSKDSKKSFEHSDYYYYYADRSSTRKRHKRRLRRR